MSSKMRNTLTLIALLFVMSSISMAAQLTTGAIAGMVTDETKAVVYYPPGLCPRRQRSEYFRKEERHESVLPHIGHDDLPNRKFPGKNKFPRIPVFLLPPG
jgi:hypothetical protein